MLICVVATEINGPSIPLKSWYDFLIDSLISQFLFVTIYLLLEDETVTFDTLSWTYCEVSSVWFRNRVTHLSYGRQCYAIYFVHLLTTNVFYISNMNYE